jgi:hypothetical protein
MARAKTKVEDGESKIAITDVGGPTQRTVRIEAPLMAGQPGYVQRHLDMQLSSMQSAALRELFDGLYARSERLRDGSPIKNGPDALRWLLAQAEAIAE